MKGECETRSNPGLPINYSTEGTQNENSIPIRCKNAKCHNECSKYKKKCLELHDKLYHLNMEENKYKNLKREITELYLGKENTDVGTEKEKILE